jgi:hypothetical protein
MSRKPISLIGDTAAAVDLRALEKLKLEESVPPQLLSMLRVWPR